MPGSGWGMEEDASGTWVANRDFAFRNLNVKKGEKLPSAWQVPQNRAYLKEHYGKECILFRDAKKPSHKETVGSRQGGK